MTVVEEEAEKHVEEVHCAECNTPMPAIPGWYAKVRVKFTCDTCRQRAPRLPSALPTLEVEPNRENLMGEMDGEPILDDAEIEAEDAELDAEEEVVEPEE